MLVNFLKKGFTKLLLLLSLPVGLILLGIIYILGRQEARSIGVNDAPTAYCNGSVLRGVQSDYSIRKYLRSILEQS